MEMSGYLRTKRVVIWACLVAWEQSVLFDGHVRLLAGKNAVLGGCVWLLANKVCYLMEMSGYLRTKRLARWTCLFTWEQSVLFNGYVWLLKNKALWLDGRVWLLGNKACYPLSYDVPVRERYGSTLLPATREQHDQNCTQSQ